jgi:hypothetical protein
LRRFTYPHFLFDAGLSDAIQDKDPDGDLPSTQITPFNVILELARAVCGSSLLLTSCVVRKKHAQAAIEDPNLSGVCWVRMMFSCAFMQSRALSQYSCVRSRDLLMAVAVWW